MSAVCAIVNQVVNPGEKYVFHKNVKKALQYIRGEVKFRELPVKEAEQMRAVAVTNPGLILGRLGG